MGNEASVTTVNWSQLSKSGEKCDISNAKDILIRLNIDYPDSDNKNNNDDNDDNKNENNNEDNNEMQKYLDEYLKKLSDDDLNKLFVKFGVNPDFDDKCDQKTKIEALKLISSKNYWRKNYKLHPLMKRVKNWLFVHEKYRGYVAEIVEKSKSDLGEAKNLFIKYDKKLSGHTDFEENMLFKFIKENVDKTKLPKNVLNELHEDHMNEFVKLTQELTKCTDLKQYEILINKYQKLTLKHLEKEEQNLIHIWLNLSELEYKKYREYLSWKYAAVY